MDYLINISFVFQEQYYYNLVLQVNIQESHYLIQELEIISETFKQLHHILEKGPVCMENLNSEYYNLDFKALA